MLRNKAWFYRQNPLTKDLSPADLDQLDAGSETLTLKKKQTVWNPGEPRNSLFFLRSGTVKIGKVTDDGRELTLHLVQRNDVFGECAIVSTAPEGTVCETYEESVVYTVPVVLFLDIMRRNRDFAMAITRVIAERRKALEARIESLLFKTAHARLAALFLDLGERFGVRDARGIIVNLKLTHKEMASLIGASRETVSFAILDLRRDGLVITEDKRVILLDMAKLVALAGS